MYKHFQYKMGGPFPYGDLAITLLIQTNLFLGKESSYTNLNFVKLRNCVHYQIQETWNKDKVRAAGKDRIYMFVLILVLD